MPNLNFLNPLSISPDDDQLDEFAREVGEALARKSDPAAIHIKGIGDRGNGTWEPQGDAAPDAEASADDAAGAGDGAPDPQGTSDAAADGTVADLLAADGHAAKAAVEAVTQDQPPPAAADPAQPAAVPSTNPAADEDKALADWARGLDPRFAQTLTSMQRGEVVAVPAADARRLEEMQRAVRQPDGSIVVQPATALSTDPQLAALQQEVAYLRQQAVAQERARIDSNVGNGEQDVAATATRYAQERGLTPDEASALMQHALDANMFLHLTRDGSTVAPDGTILRRPPMSQVTEQALNFALAARPDLMSRAYQHQLAQQTAAAVPTPTPQQLASDSAALSATSAKKARASSLAAAPTASVLTPTIDPRKMSPDQMHAEMVQMINAMEGAPNR